MRVINQHYMKSDPTLYSKIRSQAWDSFNHQRKIGQLCDVIIVSDDQQFFAHRCVLAAVSPYFEAYLSGNFQQDKVQEYYTADLSDFPPSCIRLFLDIVYQNSEIDATDVDHLDFLALLDYLHVSTFHDVIIDVIRQDIDASNCWRYLDVSYLCNINKLYDLALVFITANIKECIEDRHFNNLPVDTFLMCLGSPITHCLPIENVIDMIHTWIVGRKERRKRYWRPLIKKLCLHWQIDDNCVEKLACVAPNAFHLLKILQSKGNVHKVIQNPLFLHYSFLSSKVSYCLVDTLQGKDMSNLPALKDVKFLQQAVNGNDMPDMQFSHWKNELHMACIQKERGTTNALLVVSKYNQVRQIYDVQKVCVVQSLVPGPWQHQIREVLVSVVGMMHYKSEMFIILETVWNEESDITCCMLHLNLNNYEICGTPIVMTFKKDTSSISCVNDKNIVFLCAACDVYYIDIEKDIVKHLEDEDMFSANKSVCYKGEMYAAYKVFESTMVCFYKFNIENERWMYLFALNLAFYDEGGGYDEEVDKNTLFIVHQDKLWILLPKVEGKRARFKEVDMEAKKLGEAEFSIPIVYDGGRSLSLPNSIVL